MSQQLARLENCIRRRFALETALPSGETALHLASHLLHIRQVPPHPWRPCILPRGVEALSNTTRYSAFASPREIGA